MGLKAQAKEKKNRKSGKFLHTISDSIFSDKHLLVNNQFNTVKWYAE